VSVQELERCPTRVLAFTVSDERLRRDSPLSQRLKLLRFRLGHGSQVAAENGRQCVGEGVSLTLGNAALDGNRSFGAADPAAGVGQGVYAVQPGHCTPHLKPAEEGTEDAPARYGLMWKVRYNEPGPGPPPIQDNDLRCFLAAGVRFQGGNAVPSSTLRSSHAASCRELHTRASIEATAATIGWRCRRSRRSDQYEATRLRNWAARPTYNTSPSPSRNR
jgi:hypothetical protein